MASTTPVSALSSISEESDATTMAMPLADITNREPASEKPGNKKVTIDKLSVALLSTAVGPNNVTMASENHHPNPVHVPEFHEATFSEDPVALKQEQTCHESHAGTSGSLDHCVASLEQENDADTAQDSVSDESHGKIPKVSFHIDGDLLIKARGPDGLILYNVCSANMAACSPVWRKMIYGGECQRSCDGEWTIDMLDADDSPLGLDVLFSIAHYKFHHIQKRYDVNDLYSIALVANKYVCTHLLVPWMKEWMSGLHYHVVMNDSQNDDEKTLYTSWVFGDVDQFSKGLKKCALKAAIGPGGVLLNAKGGDWDEQGLPSEIVIAIAETRAACISDILHVVHDPVTHLLQPDAATSTSASVFKYCRAVRGEETTRRSCEHLQLGSAIAGLVKAGYYPVPDTRSVGCGAIDLATALQAIEVGRYKLPGLRPHQDDHRGCGIDHVKGISVVLEKPATLSLPLVKQLKRQAVISGAYTEHVFNALKGGQGDMEQELKELSLHEKSLFKQVTSTYAGEDATQVISN